MPSKWQRRSKTLSTDWGSGSSTRHRLIRPIAPARGANGVWVSDRRWRFLPISAAIPAFLCRQTDLLTAAALTGRVINVKKGQFLAPWDMTHVVAKVVAAGNPNVLVTERGASFGYNTLISDMRALPILASTTGAPVIFDATHSVQQPGGQGTSSGGERQFVSVLARAAVAVAVAGIFIETHQDPDKAPSDGPNMIPLNELEGLLRRLIELDRVTKRTGQAGARES